MQILEKSFFVTGGTMGRDAPSYVERQADRDLLQGLLGGEFCYVLTSRQMGKSSLMVRTADKLRREGVKALVLDLSAIGQNLTPEQWYDGFMVRMGRQSSLEDELDAFWSAHQQLSPVQRCFTAIRDVVLPKQSGRLVIFVDEIDVVRSLPFSMDEFFAAIRECYNRRTEDPELERLNFCLLGVATPSDLIRDTRITPFNIGRRIELHDFTEQEARPLATGLHLRAGASQAMAEKLLDRVLTWTNGHPYLTQRLCRELARDETDIRDGRHSAEQLIDRLCHDLFFSSRASERDDNLVFVRERLLRSEVDRASLLNLYERITRHSDVADDETNPLVSVLRLSGVVRAVNGQLVARNRIYEHVFDRSWIRANLPEADLLRQREAFRRGVLRTTAIAAVILAAMAIMVFIALSQARKTRIALAESYFSQAKARRVSGIAGQRYESLSALRKARPYYTNQAALRDETIGCLALVDLRKQMPPVHPGKSTNVVAINVDREILASAEANGSIVIRDLKSQRDQKTLPTLGSAIVRLWIAPVEPVLVAEYAGVAENQLVVWDVVKGERLFTAAGSIHEGAIDFHQESRKLAIGRVTGKITVYSVPGGEVLRELEARLLSGAPRSPYALRFNSSGKLLAESCLDDLNVQIWNVQSGEQLPSLFHPAPVYDLSWHPQRDLLATACADYNAYLWDTNYKRAKKFVGHESPVTAITFNHRGTLIATLALDETVRIWVPATERQLVLRLEGHAFDQLQFAARDTALIATDRRQTHTQVWDVVADDYLTVYDAVDGPKSLDFSPDGLLLAIVGGEYTAVWRCDSGRPLAAGNFTNVNSAKFNCDGSLLLTTTAAGLFAYRFESGDETRDPVRFKHPLPANQTMDELGPMELSGDRSMAAIVRQSEVLLLHFGTNVEARAIPVGAHYHKIGLHPAGQWLAATVTGSSSIDLLKLAEKDSVERPSTIPGSEYFAFSPDGQWFVVCSAGKFQFYRVGTWDQPAFAIGRDTESNQHAPIAFARSGDLMALASSRYTIQLFKLPAPTGHTPKLVARLEAPDRTPLEMLALSADGSRLAAATRSRALQIWNLARLRNTLADLKVQGDWSQ